MPADEAYEIAPIAHIRTSFVEKFGIPRQSGLVEEASGIIVFEPAYREPNALKGIEEFSHLWLIWGFSEVEPESISPVVRPPRLGGNEKKGVFASRSPFRPNRLGLSAVKLDEVEAIEGKGTVLHVSGVDLLNGTPIYDIKPYIPYADSIPDALGGFASNRDEGLLDVVCSDELKDVMGEDVAAILAVLERDPRPAYHEASNRIYGMQYANKSIHFNVDGDTLTVVSVEGITK